MKEILNINSFVIERYEKKFNVSQCKYSLGVVLLLETKQHFNSLRKQNNFLFFKIKLYFKFLVKRKKLSFD